MRKPQTSTSRTPYYVATALVLAIAAGPAFAASLKSIMSDMRDNTTSAKAVLASFDSVSAKQIMQRYASQAQAASEMFAGQGGAKEKDLSSRFKQLAAMANTASQTPLNKASFRKAFAEVASDCKSCHSAYK